MYPEGSPYPEGRSVYSWRLGSAFLDRAHAGYSGKGSRLQRGSALYSLLEGGKGGLGGALCGKGVRS